MDKITLPTKVLNNQLRRHPTRIAGKFGILLKKYVRKMNEFYIDTSLNGGARHFVDSAGVIILCVCVSVLLCLASNFLLSNCNWLVTFICLCVSIFCVFLSIYQWLPVCLTACLSVFVSLCLSLSVCVCLFTCICIYVYLFIYLYIYIYVSIYLFIFIYIYVCL